MPLDLTQWKKSFAAWLRQVAQAWDGAEAPDDPRSPAGAPGAVNVGRIEHLSESEVNVAGGDILKTENNYYNQVDARPLEQEKKEQARRQYLDYIRAYCQILPLGALDDPDAESEIKLDDIYIALNTTAEVETEGAARRAAPGGEKQPVPAWDAFLRTPRLALLGDPGSGKSTFVRKALALQAHAILSGQPLPEVESGLLPVLVTLRDLIPRLESAAADGLSTDRRRARLLDGLRQQVAADLQPGGLYPAAAFAEELVGALNQGQVLLALDGLDELPERLRDLAQELFTALLSACRPARVILTCRKRSYDALRRKDFQDFTLAALTEQQIGDFCQAWYRTRLGQRDPEAARQRGASLASAAADGKLRSLAENPMLLTSMAIVHFKDTRLPNERVKLYSKVVEILMENWQRHKGRTHALSPALEKLLADRQQVRVILQGLAYQAHQNGRAQASAAGEPAAADLPADATRAALGRDFMQRDYNLAAEFLDYVDQRAGLLLGRGGSPTQPAAYAFVHRTFQEYLAGCYLVNLRYPANEIKKLAGEAEYWSLAVQLGAEELYFNGLARNREDMLDLAEALFAEALPTTAARRMALWAGKMLAVAGQEIAAERCPDLLRRLRPALCDLLRSDLAAPERADAGRALAELGDPRAGVMTVAGMQFCFVPAGKFLMGSQPGVGSGDERPQHEVDLPDYWIGRYLVTNAQYAEFAAAGGYLQERYWPEAQEAGVWQNGKVKGWGEDVFRDRPHDFGAPYHLPNHPVVGVTWYEMLAFTRWLDERLGDLLAGRASRAEAADRQLLQSIAGRRLRAALPSEAEWEKAARGVDGRVYPWIGEFDPNRANLETSGIGTTSAVGCFPAGSSPYGCEEMAGNAWEWTRSVYKPYPYTDAAVREDLKASSSPSRVLRGGCFGNDPSVARCAFRNWGSPVNGDWYNGFRVVLLLCR